MPRRSAQSTCCRTRFDQSGLYGARGRGRRGWGSLGNGHFLPDEAFRLVGEGRFPGSEGLFFGGGGLRFRRNGNCLGERVISRQTKASTRRTKAISRAAEASPRRNGHFPPSEGLRFPREGHFRPGDGLFFPRNGHRHGEMGISSEAEAISTQETLVSSQEKALSSRAQYEDFCATRFFPAS